MSHLITAIAVGEGPSQDLEEAARHYDTVARAIAYLRQHAREQPSLEHLAAEVGLSPHHLQRVFTRWAGVSPKRFVQVLTRAHAREALKQSASVLEAALASGLSGPGRLHDLMVVCEAMSPGEVQSGGQGVMLQWGRAPTPFGMAMLGWTPRGLCHLMFCDTSPGQDLMALRAEWPAAELQENPAGALDWSRRIFRAMADGLVGTEGPLPLLLKGSNFQIKVWEALLRSHPGQVLSYGQLARQLDMPGAARAVGSAVAANTLGWLIPCHRVLREGGDWGQYRWGTDRKAAVLAWEASLLTRRLPAPEWP
ncbi:MAG TPA: methylated-DNA--[protein]-cysteine S-methyltransferase [Aquabacterium sp.]|uniref:methylated-DNA--[protein]-cysteine S-methyltransferase n=1 Tax=Aquabacterium sp. TaxID=1872578 RepID=UPI002E36DE6C|nr:methylated-DNA--[protein]-cysteine S-methyltransferase [Aquabacterium sp.]HEX5374310.1 methylated-DNA--[protein]-cysteine S-methyltransferase [Aquabacterium sp.]